MTDWNERGRRRVARVLDEAGGGLLLVPTAGVALRNGDVSHSFRPGSDFWYLTGFPEPNAVLAAWKDGRGRVQRVLFVQPRDRDAEIWDGRRFGVAGAKRRFGADEAYPIDELWKRLPEFLADHDRLLWCIGARPDLDEKLFSLFRRRVATKEHRRANRPAHPVLQDPTPIIAQHRLIKDDDEIATMRRAAEVTAEAHVAAMAAAQPNMNELQVQAVLEEVFRRHGSRRNGYDSIVASGANACILHYVENDRALRRGDLLLLDAGAEIDMYTADITRTWPVDGAFTEPQKAVYGLVLKAQNAAIRAVKVGRPWDAPHLAASRVIAQGLIDLGLLKGTAKRVLEDGKQRQFFMHGTSHWLGIDVHDSGSYTDAKGKPVRFEPGMVLTVEPGLYFDPKDKAVPKELRGIGVRIEDDVHVTAEGPEVLTADCPKTIRDVEAACRALA